jgi:hypothetical protein
MQGLPASLQHEDSAKQLPQPVRSIPQAALEAAWRRFCMALIEFCPIEN